MPDLGPTDELPIWHAWIIALLWWEHSRDRREWSLSDAGVPVTGDRGPAALLAVLDELGEPSPLDVTAQDLAAAAQAVAPSLPGDLAAVLPEALADFTRWGVGVGVLDGTAEDPGAGRPVLELLR
ncbi:hypothetical protein ACT3SY_09280 [Brachybacterium sp. AOP42-E1-35]|uniref:hypothetical protein n=1 Tax=unclassified Brachybacterium TaxID=2623841 RepID=UPI00402B02A9